jgi:CheY-like chemotaxis protein
MSPTDVLVVDDNPGMTDSIALILRRKGYSVATAANGLRAIDLIEEQPFHVILMDVRMPGMDGFEAHRRIQCLRPESPVILMTAYLLDDRMQQALDDGVFEILSKPLDIRYMLSVIERARQTVANLADEGPGPAERSDR